MHDWPVLTAYDQDHLLRVALPLGGIGTGTVSLGGRGDLRDWEIMNRPAKGNTQGRNFFCIHTRDADGRRVTRALEGVLDPVQFEGASGCTVANHGLPRFRECRFLAAYPFGQVELRDPDVPLEVTLQAFNPLIPCDAEAGGLPVAVLRFRLHNPGPTPVDTAICGTLTNVTGADGTAENPCLRRTRGMTSSAPQPLTGLLLGAEGTDPGHERWGTLALTALTDAPVSSWPEWQSRAANSDLTAFWDEFSADGVLGAGAWGDPQPNLPTFSSLAVPARVEPGGTVDLTFLITWHFPNRMTWTPSHSVPEDDCDCCDGNPDHIGNHYASLYEDAWDVAVQVAERLPDLEARTLAFVNALCDSDLPHDVVEAALFNLSTLRTETCFRTEDGHFFGWEGCCDGAGCCHGSCTHVWNYEQATAFLFGDLARDMREIEFLHATDDQGLMSFRVNLPIHRAREHGVAAADGQMGCFLKLYRDWQLCGDDKWLERLWPSVRRAMEFTWLEGGWDADQDGVMEGCQHNTMDVEYFGPNPQMGFWYLGALRAVEEMARHVGDAAFADRCRTLFENGSSWIDAKLFNGEYYEHRIMPEKTANVRRGLRHGGNPPPPEGEPDFQLGAGCLVDQLVGQFMAHVCGLGYLANPDHIRATLRSIYRCNRQENLYAHFNNMRTFALSDEAAMLMAVYPRGRRPVRPFPYYNEVMTGFEYTAAVGMLFEGLTAEGLQCISDIRARYDGRRRSPFDEAECGHHYARAMASWAAIQALTGFGYSAVSATVTFAALEGKHFWASGHAWGTCEIRRDDDGRFNGELQVLGGTLQVRCLELRGIGTTQFDAAAPALTAGIRQPWSIAPPA